MTIFWDASGIVPLIVREAWSPVARRVAEDDPRLVVWWGSVVECLSAIGRQERSGALSHSGADEARRVLAAISAGWTEVVPSEEVRGQAGTLLRRHPLRAADALQLAAALIWSEGRPRGHRFMTLDERLASAARGEGFDLAPAHGEGT